MKHQLPKSLSSKQRFPQAAEHSTLLLGSGVEAAEICLREETLAPADGGLGNDLEQRAGGDLDETRGIGPGVTAAALSNVRGNGHGGPAHLVGETEALIRWECARKRVNKVSKINGSLPSIKFFKVKHGIGLAAEPSTINSQPLNGSINYQPSTIN